MKLYQKTLLGMLVTVMALTGCLAILWRTVLLGSYADFEARDTRSDVKRAASALEDRIANINGHLNDWAAWDPTYRYMENRDKAYLDDNFAGPVTLRDLGLNVVAYVSPDGTLVHASAIDPAAATPTAMAFPADLLPHLALGRPLVTHQTARSRVSGIILLEKGPLLLASQPIVRGSHEGPLRGSLVWGRYLTADEIKQLADTTHLSVAIRRFDDPTAPEDMKLSGRELARAPPGTSPIRALNEERVAGYELLRDIYGKPALLMRVDRSRSIFKQGLASAKRSLATLIVACLIFLVVVGAMLRWIILNRLANLSEDVSRIGELGNPVARVRAVGKDELGTLARAINEMLGEIERSQETIREREALRRSEEHYRGLVDSSPMAVLIVREGALVFANASAVRLVGADELEGLVGRPIREMLALENLLTGPEAPLIFRREMKLRQLAGTQIEVELVGSSITFEGGPALQLVVQDISERKQAEHRLNYLAYHDLLTGLPNRLLYTLKLEQAIGRARDAGERLVVMGMDLDRFKEVNDIAGHAGGDRLMIEIADRLRSAIRSSDIVARISGDEFYFICPQSVTQGPDQMARRLIELFGDPVRIDAHEFYLTPSIGISIFPSDGETVEALTRNADVAMYRAKANGGNGFQYFDPALGEALTNRRTMQSHLRKALALEELELYYQPQIDIDTHRVEAAEVLLRWRHPELGMVSPAQFIPIAEETGMIIPITDWVLRMACQQSQAWRKAGTPVRLAVNLSGRHFHPPHHLSLVRYVKSLLEEFEIPPNQLELEITESTAINNLENTQSALTQLDDMGVLLSIDDFGTGYSSLSYLGKFPVHSLKIDRSFVDGVDSNCGNQAVIEAILAMAHALKLKVVGEGVETAAELKFLQSRECDVAQGYLISRPMDKDAFARWLEQWLHSNPIRESELRAYRRHGQSPHLETALS